MSESFKYIRFLNLLLLLRVLNEILHLSYSTGFWICFDFSRVVNILGSEYPRILNVLELHMVLNKVPHNRYLAGFWICSEFWICQFYTEFCRKRPIIHVWQSSSDNSPDNQYASAWIYKEFWIWQGYIGLSVSRILKIHGIWISWVMPRFWFYQESKYAIVTKGSE